MIPQEATRAGQTIWLRGTFSREERLGKEALERLAPVPRKIME